MAKKKTAKRKAIKKAVKKVVGKRKAAAKTKAAPKARAKAGAARPTYKVDTVANRKQTQRRSKWFTFDQGNNQLLFIPPMGGSKILTPQTSLHYSVKRADDPTKNIAPACLHVHGDGNCYICSFMDYCMKSKDPIMVGIAEELDPTTQNKAQCFAYDKSAKEWYGPVVVAMPAGLTKQVEALLSMSEDTGAPQFCDPSHSQAINVHRVGTGKYGTKYTYQMGVVVNMYDEIPDWESRAFTNLMTSLEIKVLDINQQKERLVATFPDLPWEDIEKAIG